jgi:hypothetical protein
MAPKSSHTKQQTIFSWVFGSLFFIVLTYLLLREEPIPANKRGLVAFFCGLMGALFAFFFTGRITARFNLSDWGKTSISATGGFAIFVIVFLALLKNLPKEDQSKFQLQIDFTPVTLIDLSGTRILATTNLTWWGSSNPPPRVRHKAIQFVETTLERALPANATNMVYKIFIERDAQSPDSTTLVISNETERAVTDGLLTAMLWFPQGGSQETNFLLQSYERDVSYAADFWDTAELLMSRPGYQPKKLSSSIFKHMLSGTTNRQFAVDMAHDRRVLSLESNLPDDSLLKELQSRLSIQHGAAVYGSERIKHIRSFPLIHLAGNTFYAPTKKIFYLYDTLQTDAMIRMNVTSFVP